ncbi:MAG: hypothetical protein KTR25_15070 [Myxococcales bacterium]|nr:hypothetical protein [Myxococcales bacterium]
MKRYLLALALFTTIGACGDDEDFSLGDACNDACSDEEVCDDRTIDPGCVTSCELDNSCAGTIPECNTEPTNNAPLGVCVCNETSCPDGEVCLANGLCGEEGAPLCGTIGEQGTCPDGETCTADGCQEGDPLTCVNLGETGCLAQQQLCQTDVNAGDDYNQCVDPQQINGSCDNASNHQRDSDGPIILSVAYGRDLETTDDCRFVREFAAQIALPDENVDIQSSLYSQRLKGLGPNGGERLVYSAGVDSPSHPSLSEPDSDDNDNIIDLIFTLCLEDEDAINAIFLRGERDGTELVSNAVCFSVSQ